MGNAVDNPVKRQYTRKEVHTADIGTTAKKDVVMGMPSASENVVLDHAEPLELVTTEMVSKDYLAQLAFMEEPVTVSISDNSGTKHPATHVPCFVNGKGAEILLNGKWVEFKNGYIPIGPQLVMKRKYVEILVRSRSDLIETDADDANVEHPENRIIRRNRDNYPLSIIHDANPRGHQWLQAVRYNHA